jgi:hypothetical protein
MNHGISAQQKALAVVRNFWVAQSVRVLYDKMKRTFFLFVILLVSSLSYSQAKVFGYIHDLITGKPLEGTRVTLSLLDSIQSHVRSKDDIWFRIYSSFDSVYYDTSYKKLETTFTDSHGFYLFDCVVANIYSLSAFYKINEFKPGIWSGESFDTSGIQITSGSQIQKSFKFHVTCEYDSTANLTHCPRCNQGDKVLLIVYGLTGPLREPGHYYNGNCSPERCHPTKRCMRCNYEF